MNGHCQFASARSTRLPVFSLFFLQGFRVRARTIFFAAFFLTAQTLLAQTNNTSPVAAPAFPETGMSLLRVTGALALVLGLFLGGAWFFKNWQRLAMQRGSAPKLNILETRSLGARQAVFVVGYEKQRFLVATSPAGVNLLSHLPDNESVENVLPEKSSAPMSFGQALVQVLKKK